MGNAQGGPGADNGDEGEHMGYRVLGVQAGSPAASAGLVSFFDFIIEANNQPLKRLDNTFVDLIKEYEDRPLAIKIYNFKSQRTRDVVITPSTKWEGQGMLGVTIRFDCFEEADEHLVRVLEVVPNSPAELAGLQPKTDYLLGTAETAFKNPDVLEEILARNLDQTVDFYVYSTETDTVRMTTLMPTLKWGGNGCLGAAIGHGYLHSLPRKCCDSNGTSVFRNPAPNITDATRASKQGGSRSTTPSVEAPSTPVVIGEQGLVKPKSPAPGNEAGQWARAASPGTAKQAGPPGGGPLPPPPTPAPPQPMVSVVDVDLSGHQAVKPVVAGQA